MNSAAQVSDVDRSEVSLIVGSGLKIGVITTIGVAAFALVSRPLDGMVETVVQSIFILVGMAIFSYLPANFVRVRTIDGVGWAMLVGLLGALFFTVFDTVILRPVDLYHWTWDAIGGGSGFWYIPVLWMGSAFLAWLGAWVVATSSQQTDASVPAIAGQTVGIGIVIGGILMATGLVPFHSAGFALAFTIGLVLHVPLAGVMHKG